MPQNNPETEEYLHEPSCLKEGSNVSGVRKLQKMTHATRERQAYCIFIFRFQIAGWHGIKNSHHLATE
jgi:hypothetical protein